MTVTDAPMNPHPASVDAAMTDVAAAGRKHDAAKRDGRVEALESAKRELQGAVDAARALGAEWGQIGAALGIARGNAYQRFRRKAFGWPSR